MLNEAITTDRLILRPVCKDDAPALNVLMTRGVAQRLSNVPWPCKIDDTYEYLARAARENIRGDGAHFVIEDRNEPCGAISLQQRDGALTLGYWLGESWWGRGLMSEAVETFVDTFFTLHDVVHITSGVFAGNHAAIRVQEKLGFVIVGETPRYSRSLDCTLPHLDTVLGRARRIPSLVA